MQVDVQDWLSRIPFADEQLADGIVLDGWLLVSAHGEARIVTGRLCLAFVRADVVAVEEIADEGCAAGTTHAVHVRLVLTPGARLLAAGPAELFDDALPSRAPFALATRPRVVRSGAMPRFRALERAYLDR